MKIIAEDAKIYYYVFLTKTMGRIMAIDYGTKRTGLAVTDPSKLVAGGLTTLSPDEAIPFIVKYHNADPLECIVIGDPGNLNGRREPIAKKLNVFIKKLSTALTAVKIERYDERFTSRMAFESMVTAGLRKHVRKDKSLVDKISAVIILQSYLTYLESRQKQSAAK